MSVRQVVEFTVNEGSEDKFVSAIKKMVETTKKSEGCVSSELHQEIGGNNYVIFELWESEAHCDKDNSAPYVQEFLTAFEKDMTVTMKKYKLL